MKKKFISLSRKDLVDIQKKSNRGSKMLPFMDQIICFHKSNVSFAVITRWLKDNGIVTSSENVRQFCMRYLHQYENVELVLSDENGPTDDQNGGDSQNEEDDEYEDDDIAYSDL